MLGRHPRMSAPLACGVGITETLKSLPCYSSSPSTYSYPCPAERRGWVAWLGPLGAPSEQQSCQATLVPEPLLTWLGLALHGAWRDHLGVKWQGWISHLTSSPS